MSIVTRPSHGYTANTPRAEKELRSSRVTIELCCEGRQGKAHDRRAALQRQEKER